MLIRAAIVAALLSLPAAAADVTGEVPAKFIGDWCTEYLPGEEETGESDLRIAANEVGYYRVSGKILAAAAIGQQLALIVQLRGDGHTWLATHEFELAADGARLTSLRSDSQLHTRIKCQRPTGAPPNNSSSPRRTQ